MAKRLKIVVVMDPLETVKPETDSSLVMMAEGCQRGHEVYFVEEADLTVEAGKLTAQAVALQASMTPPYFSQMVPTRLDMHKVDVVLIRKDPPFDAGYLYLTQLLDLIVDEALIINRPSGLRAANEKLFILNFPTLTPPTLVTAELAQVRDFAKKHKQSAVQGKFVMKPLHLFGGQGVTALSAADFSNGKLEAVFNELSSAQQVHQKRLPIMLQPFLHAERGDKRIILINGKIAGAVLRVPKVGEFRSNLRFGATPMATEITKQDKKICGTIAPALKKLGLYLVGLDVLDGRLTEVNVTSPTAFQAIQRVSGVAVVKPLFDFIERQRRNKDERE